MQNYWSTPIISFTGENFFLSNFCPCKIEYEGITYYSTEAAYQAAKTDNPVIKLDIASANTAAKAKRFGGRVKLRED